MNENSDQSHRSSDHGHALEVAGILLNRLVGLVTTIVVLGFILVLALVGAYLIFCPQPLWLQRSSCSGGADAIATAQYLARCYAYR